MDSDIGRRAFDSFSIPNGGSVDVIRWRGTYINHTFGAWEANNPDPNAPNTATWEISAYLDNGGLPGTQSTVRNVSFASATTTELGLSTWNILDPNDDQNILATVQAPGYEFEVNLGSAINFSAGTTYWLSILSEAAFSYQPEFIWWGASGGDDQLVTQSLAGGAFSTVPNDAMFWLCSTTCLTPPEIGLISNQIVNEDEAHRPFRSRRVPATRRSFPTKTFSFRGPGRTARSRSPPRPTPTADR
jgi:hypothetical protein